MTLSNRDTAKFGLLVGLSAIFIDAVIAHGLFWENDPYWTYWITKTFLITTVFIAGTAFFGVGFIQGLALTAVHTAILEIYYEFLAPIGLPQEPQWLDDNHLYTNGHPGPLSRHSVRLFHRLVDLAARQPNTGAGRANR